MTLTFVGSVDAATAKGLQQELAQIRMDGFDLEVGGHFIFGPETAPRVIWTGVHDTTKLSELQERVSVAGVSAGLAREEREFAPHVTIARVDKANPSDVRQYLRDAKPIALPRFTVSEFVLFESEQSSADPTYSARQRYRFTN